jgi:wobble nucleotide-excising tRNase
MGMSGLDRIQLLRNVGQFDNVDAGAWLPLSKLTLIYAENGRGKTTLAAILRSLSTGDGTFISERHRLSATKTPHVVIGANGTSFLFQNDAWSANLPDLVVFDDLFVAQNVCSGIDIQTEHRQNLHELILGAQGVSLNDALQTHVARVEAHNRELRLRGDAIPPASRGPYNVDAFCALERNPNIGQAIQEAERSLAAAKSAEAVRQRPEFANLSLPTFDVATVNAALQLSLPALEADAAARVQAHFAALGPDSEEWVSEGMQRINDDVCPFCAQDLGTSPLIEHYRAYFSEAYTRLKTNIADQIAAVEKHHGGDIPAAFERAVRVAIEAREFWRPFTQVPDVALDTAAIARAWKAAREGVLEALRAKQASPLEPTGLSKQTTNSIEAYGKCVEAVASVSDALQAVNPQIAIVKEQAAAANVAILTSELAKLKAVQARYDPAIEPLCQAYLDEKTRKAQTEALREQARTALDNYRTAVFPAYETAINAYLRKFNAGFSLGSVSSVNTRAGSSCTYNVVINNVPVAVTADAGGVPAFRNTLSSGDRNALALAFFFASLDRDPQLAEKIVVIDDPMTSLDEHRSLTTIQGDAGEIERGISAFARGPNDGLIVTGSPLAIIHRELIIASDAARVRHAPRKRGGCVAACGARAAAGDARGWIPGRWSARTVARADRRVPGGPQGIRLHRRPQHGRRIPLCRGSIRSISGAGGRAGSPPGGRVVCGQQRWGARCKASD